MKKFKIYLVSLLASTCISCVSDSDSNESDDEHYTIQAQEEFFGSVFNSEQLPNQTFSFNSNRDTLLVGEKGTKIRIFSNSFVTTDGSPYEGKVTLEFKEAFDPVDFVMGNLTTVTERGILQTGGMIYLNALDNRGGLLMLDEGQTIGVVVPTEDLDTDMSIFQGQRNGGLITWSEPVEILNDEINEMYRSTNWVWYSYRGMDSLEMEEYYRDSLVHWFWKPEREVGDTHRNGDRIVWITSFTTEVDTIRFQELEDGTFIQEVVTMRGANSYIEDFNTNYIFTVKGLGWTNIDKIYQDERSDYVDFYVNVSNKDEFDYVYTSLMIDEQSVYIPGYQRKDRRFGFTNDDYDRPKLPIGATCKILATAYKDQEPYFWIQEHTISSKQEIQMTLKPSTIEEMRAELEERL